MSLQLTALTPSLTGTLQYSTGVTAFTFSISSRVNLCWNHSLLRHQQGMWLTGGHQDTSAPSVIPKPQSTCTAATPPSQRPAPTARLQSPPNALEKTAHCPALWLSGNFWFTTAEMRHTCSSQAPYLPQRQCFPTYAPTASHQSGERLKGVTITVPRTPLSWHQHSSALLFSQRVITTSCPYEIYPESPFPQVQTWLAQKRNSRETTDLPDVFFPCCCSKLSWRTHNKPSAKHHLDPFKCQPHLALKIDFLVTYK